MSPFPYDDRFGRRALPPQSPKTGQNALMFSEGMMIMLSGLVLPALGSLLLAYGLTLLFERIDTLLGFRTELWLPWCLHIALFGSGVLQQQRLEQLEALDRMSGLLLMLLCIGLFSWLVYHDSHLAAGASAWFLSFMPVGFGLPDSALFVGSLPVAGWLGVVFSRQVMLDWL